MSSAAVPEGVILGGLQAKGIRWFVPAVSTPKWIFATTAVGLLGWAIGKALPMFVFSDAPSDQEQPAGLIATAAFAATFGLAVGAVFGLAQALALPTGKAGKVRWTLANTVGWAIALPCI
jgi:hypothetical protein